MTRTLPLVKKEIRAVAPVTAMCIAVVVLAGLLGEDWRALGLLTYAVGSVSIGAAVIGHEFGHSTLGTLLVQPVARERLLAVKCFVAALAVAGIGAAASFVGLLDRVPSELLSTGQFQLLVVLAALSVAPWLTMLTGSAMAGTVATLASPIILAVVLGWLGVFGANDINRFRFLAGAMIALSAVAAGCGWGLFTRRLEDLTGSAGHIHLWFGRRFEVAGSAGSHRRPFGKSRELIGKEIRLQQLPLVIAGLYFVTSLLAWLTTDVVPADLDPRQDITTWLYGGATALLIGAVASAEERQLGTMPWQIILPVPAWQQFVVKSVLAVALSVALTWALPGLMALTLAEPSSAFWLPEYSLATIALTMVGLYVSSLTESSLRAFLTSLPAIAGLAGLVALARGSSFPVGLFAYDAGYSVFETWLVWAEEFSRREVEFAVRIAFGIVAVGLVAMAWRFALANHSRADGVGRHVWRQGLSLASCVLIGSLSVYSVRAAVIYGGTNRGAISGVVVDEHGSPVAGVLVRAARQRYLAGHRRLVPSGSYHPTDDRGRFLIGRLAPGDYYPVALTGPFSLTAFASPTTSGFAPTLYPSTTDGASAQAVVVDGRSEVADLTIEMVRAPVARLAGRLTDESGQPVGQGEVFFGPAETDDGVTPSWLAIGKSGPDGRFSFDDVPSGTYTVQARGPLAAGRNDPFGWRVVTIDGDDLTEVDITLTAGAVLRGSVVFEGDASPPTPNEVRVSTQATRLTLARSNASRVQDDLTFEVTRLSGRHLVRAVLLRNRRLGTDFAAAWILKEISLDGRDVTDTPLDFRSGDDIDGLEVALTDQVAHVIGSVHDRAGQSSSSGVVIFSADPAGWTFPSRFVHRVWSGRNGYFRTPALLPGDYLVVALSRSSRLDWEDPELLEELRPLATPVTLSVGDAIELSLVIAR